MHAPRLWQRLARDRAAMTGLGIVTALALVALTASWVAPADPLRGTLSDALRPPSHGFWLGSDIQGRDILSRVIFGARLSLAVGLVSQTVACLLGLILG